ncbi:MAG: hypothetical protein COB37_10690 [Kordiimonadales bacterium]|nr:MAG: hypothetical protein COB37_10690 [Kordiimonadales bacterium]
MSILVSLNHRFNTWLLSKKCRRVLKVAAIKTTDDPLVFVSQLRHSDLLPYLVAIKSIYRTFKKGGVIVLSDGSLTSKDKQILREQIQGIDIRDISDVDLCGLQSGGTWERLVTLVQESQKRYAIQVDADLITTQEVSEIFQLWQDNISFALANPNSPGKLTFRGMADWIKEQGLTHIQHVTIVSELALGLMENGSDQFYQRTTSAFAGIAKGGAKLTDLIAFSKEMESTIGDKWYEWGSEQVGSNYIVANAPNSIELDTRFYMNNGPDIDLTDAKLIHFFGTYRFYQKRYFGIIEKILADLQS